MFSRMIFTSTGVKQSPRPTRPIQPAHSPTTPPPTDSTVQETRASESHPIREEIFLHPQWPRREGSSDFRRHSGWSQKWDGLTQFQLRLWFLHATYTADPWEFSSTSQRAGSPTGSRLANRVGVVFWKMMSLKFRWHLELSRTICGNSRGKVWMRK
jgi:hypothetical protein